MSTVKPFDDNEGDEDETPTLTAVDGGAEELAEELKQRFAEIAGEATEYGFSVAVVLSAHDPMVDKTCVTYMHTGNYFAVTGMLHYMLNNLEGGMED